MAFIFTVCLVAIGLNSLVFGESCFERIQSIANNRQLLGGYRTLDEPASDDDVTRILDLALRRLNNRDDQQYEFDRDDDGNIHRLEAYRQVVILTHEIMPSSEVGLLTDGTVFFYSQSCSPKRGSVELGW